jgi:hypothetical protein
VGGSIGEPRLHQGIRRSNTINDRRGIPCLQLRARHVDVGLERGVVTGKGDDADLLHGRPSNPIPSTVTGDERSEEAGLDQFCWLGVPELS